MQYVQYVYTEQPLRMQSLADLLFVVASYRTTQSSSAHTMLWHPLLPLYRLKWSKEKRRIKRAVGVCFQAAEERQVLGSLEMKRSSRLGGGGGGGGKARHVV